MTTRNRAGKGPTVREPGPGTDLKSPISVGDEVWLATALLHREHPEREDFTVQEITARAERENVHGRLRPGVYVHAIQHCVANRPPKPARYRMLFATGKKTRRLFRPRDSYDPKREGSKTIPDRADLPARYRSLVDWYEREYVRSAAEPSVDPILALRGLGKEIWADERADDYVRRMRRDWE